MTGVALLTYSASSLILALYIVASSPERVVSQLVPSLDAFPAQVLMLRSRFGPFRSHVVRLLEPLPVSTKDTHERGKATKLLGNRISLD
ncbi:hypothetical protein NDU88_006581 [Pleurodeles waltl]|uniref:Uncharacterized protein n=1 Tax=Pleurodeles waltl TaxID=8319 RepID=A0AAV7SQC1_PLEWA|nr:hypothetical protein NDU88_006581 [Pleurodeles waltl]